MINFHTPKVPSLVLFNKSICGWPTLKFFYRRLGRQHIQTLRRSTRQKKRNFFVKTFRKLPKNGFCDLFFRNLPAAQKIWPKQRLFSILARKINLVDLKKKVVKIFENLFKIRPPPRENPRFAPDLHASE